MAQFSTAKITEKGQELIAKLQSGEAVAEFTRISTSSAQYSLEDLEDLDELADVVQTSPISGLERVNEKSILTEAAFTNTELTDGYYVRTVGLYANDPDNGEILYAVAIETSGSCYMPAYDGQTTSGLYIRLQATVGNADNISLEMDPAATATIKNIYDLQVQIDRITNGVVVTLSAGDWSDEEPYSQTVAVEGMQETDKVHIYQYTPSTLPSDTVKLYRKMAAMITDGETADGAMTFYCGITKPTDDFQVYVEGVSADG